MADILDNFNKQDIALFYKDFIQLIKIAEGMQRNYIESNTDFDLFMPKYDELIKLFNKKYKGLHLKLLQTTNRLRLRIFLKNEKNIKDVFMNAASKVAGLKSIGTTRLGVAEVDSPHFSRELERIKDKAQISYYDPHLGSTTIFLEYDKKTKMVEIRYHHESITDRRDPEFKLCAFYALSQGYNKKVDLFQTEAEFAFNDWSEPAKKKFLDTFDPKLYE